MHINGDFYESRKIKKGNYIYPTKKSIKIKNQHKEIRKQNKHKKSKFLIILLLEEKDHKCKIVATKNEIKSFMAKNGKKSMTTLSKWLMVYF